MELIMFRQRLDKELSSSLCTNHLYQSAKSPQTSQENLYIVGCAIDQYFDSWLGEIYSTFLALGIDRMNTKIESKLTLGVQPINPTNINKDIYGIETK